MVQLPMDAQRRRLHAEAVAATAAAREAFTAVTRPGTPEWDLWTELCRQAINAHDAYIRALTSQTDGTASAAAIVQ